MDTGPNISIIMPHQPILQAEWCPGRKCGLGVPSPYNSVGFPQGEAGSHRETDGRLKRVFSALVTLKKLLHK